MSINLNKKLRKNTHKNIEPSKKWEKLMWCWFMYFLIFHELCAMCCVFGRPSIRHYFVKCAFISILLSSMKNGKKNLTVFLFLPFPAPLPVFSIFMCERIFIGICIYLVVLGFVKLNYFSNWKFPIHGILSPITDECIHS